MTPVFHFNSFILRLAYNIKTWLTSRSLAPWSSKCNFFFRNLSRCILSDNWLKFGLSYCLVNTPREFFTPCQHSSWNTIFVNTTKGSFQHFYKVTIFSYFLQLSPYKTYLSRQVLAGSSCAEPLSFLYFLIISSSLLFFPFNYWSK